MADRAVDLRRAVVADGGGEIGLLDREEVGVDIGERQVVGGQPVAKLSDTPGKTLCSDETFLAYLRQVFKQAA